MISNLTSGVGAIRESADRFEGSADRLARLNTGDEAESRPVEPTEQTDGGREARADTTGEKLVQQEDTVKIDRDKVDLAREVSEQIQAEIGVKSGVALIRSTDETLGTILDILA